MTRNGDRSEEGHDSKEGLRHSLIPIRKFGY